MPVLSLKMIRFAKTASTSGDTLVSGLGISVAMLSAGFAGYMVLADSANQRAEAVSAGPGSINPLIVMSTGQRPAPQAVSSSDAIDFAPTGSVASDADGSSERPRDGESAAGKPPTILHDFKIRDVFDGSALIETRDALRLVTAGTMLEGAGTVLAIRREGPAWIVQTTAGIIAQRRR